MSLCCWMRSRRGSRALTSMARAAWYSIVPSCARPHRVPFTATALMLEPTRLPSFRSCVRATHGYACRSGHRASSRRCESVQSLLRRMRQERSSDVCAALDAQRGVVLYCDPREWLERLANALIEALEVRLARRTVRLCSVLPLRVLNPAAAAALGSFTTVLLCVSGDADADGRHSQGSASQSCAAPRGCAALLLHCTLVGTAAHCWTQAKSRAYCTAYCLGWSQPTKQQTNKQTRLNQSTDHQQQSDRLVAQAVGQVIGRPAHHPDVHVLVRQTLLPLLRKRKQIRYAHRLACPF